VQHSDHDVPPDLRLQGSHGHDQSQSTDKKRLTRRNGLEICVGKHTLCRAGRATRDV
jgi:hypothetical protein